MIENAFLRRMKYLALLAIIAGLPAYAQSPAPRKTQVPQQSEEAQRHLDNAIRLIEELRVTVEQAILNKRMQCLRTVGNPQFCKCISEETPPVANFMDYAAATSLTNQELNYSKLKPKDQELIDNLREGRVKCAGRMVWD